MSKQCTKCLVIKELTEFYKQHSVPNAACKDCNKRRSKTFREFHIERDRVSKKAYKKTHKEKIFKDSKKWRKLNKDKLHKDKTTWRKDNPQKIRKYGLMAKFGITEQQYVDILKLQLNCCAICQRHRSEFKKDFAVDHDHSTKKIRGLLCMTCNIALGSLRDSIDLLQKAINYLEKQGGHITSIVQID